MNDHWDTIEDALKFALNKMNGKMVHIGSKHVAWKSDAETVQRLDAALAFVREQRKLAERTSVALIGDEVAP